MCKQNLGSNCRLLPSCPKGFLIHCHRGAKGGAYSTRPSSLVLADVKSIFFKSGLNISLHLN